jgi:hypothetical protein
VPRWNRNTFAEVVCDHQFDKSSAYPPLNGVYDGTGAQGFGVTVTSLATPEPVAAPAKSIVISFLNQRLSVQKDAFPENVKLATSRYVYHDYV